MKNFEEVPTEDILNIPNILAILVETSFARKKDYNIYLKDSKKKKKKHEETKERSITADSLDVQTR